MNEDDRALEFAIHLARRVGAFLLRRARAPKGERVKGATELVTDVDRAAEARIVQALQEAFSGHDIEAEEGLGQVCGAPYRWYVDPLDGTHNYVHGYPHYAVSLALWENDEPLVGVVYEPVRHECFWAARGRGAYLNGRSICVSTRARLSESLVSTGFPYNKAIAPDNNLAEFARVAPVVSGIRRSGSAALDLCYVAAGRQEAHWEIGLKPWDVAAAGLIVREAGGQITGPGGRPWDLREDRIVASNGRVHEELLQVLGWL
ncbi:MAG: inositol monophosphatase family protein [Chloroflexia bacterium]